MGRWRRFACGIIAAGLVLSSAASAHAWAGHDGRRGHFFGPHGQRAFFGARVFVGPVFPGPAFGPPVVYYPYPAPVYAAPVGSFASPPPPQYWYYCPDNRLYYPYTQHCPGGWLQVVPSPR